MPTRSYTRPRRGRGPPGPPLRVRNAWKLSPVLLREYCDCERECIGGTRRRQAVWCPVFHGYGPSRSAWTEHERPIGDRSPASPTCLKLTTPTPETGRSIASRGCSTDRPAALLLPSRGRCHARWGSGSRGTPIRRQYRDDSDAVATPGRNLRLHVERTVPTARSDRTGGAPRHHGGCTPANERRRSPDRDGRRAGSRSCSSPSRCRARAITASTGGPSPGPRPRGTHRPATPPVVGTISTRYAHRHRRLPGGAKARASTSWRGRARNAQPTGSSAELKEVNAEPGDTDADREARLRDLADAGYYPIFAIGSTYAGAVAEVAPDYPETRFGTIDDGSVDGPKVIGIQFHEEQGSFLSARPRALTSKTGKVGFIGAAQIPGSSSSRQVSRRGPGPPSRRSRFGSRTSSPPPDDTGA